MKIEQEKSFKPVVITLETPEEVDDFWEALTRDIIDGEPTPIIIELYNWLSDKVSF